MPRTDWGRVRRLANSAAWLHGVFAALIGASAYYLWYGTAPWKVHTIVHWMVLLGLVSLTLAASAVTLGRWAATGRGNPHLAALAGLSSYGVVFALAAFTGVRAAGRLDADLLVALLVLGILFSPSVLCSTAVLRRRPDAPELQDAPPMRTRGAWAGLLLGLLIVAVFEISIPKLGRRGGYSTSNESAGIGALRSLSTAQEQFKQQNVVDQDADGMGEYGWLGELAGGDAVRISGLKMNTSPFIAAILGIKDARGFAQKSGYYFVAYLPTASGVAAGEAHVVDSAGNSADADGQETRWCVYAWPNRYPDSGRQAFFVNASGEVYATAMDTLVYTGTTSVPAADAAYERGTGRNLAGGVGLAAAGLTSNDGNTWVPAGN
jgi:hypothetical protein